MATFDALRPLALHHAHYVPDQPGPWSSVWPLLLTALLTLVILGIVQFYMVPIVETRKRREDRWEEDVLALGELLTFEFQNAQSDLRQALSAMSSLNDLKGDDTIDQSRLEERLRLSRERVGAAGDNHRALRGRISWLTDRIIAIDPSAQALLKFRVKEIGLILGQLEDLAFKNRYTTREVPTMDQISEATASEHKMLKELIAEVTKLAAGKPVRAPTWWRRAWRRVQPRLKKLRTRYKRTDKTDSNSTKPSGE